MRERVRLCAPLPEPESSYRGAPMSRHLSLLLLLLALLVVSSCSGPSRGSEPVVTVVTIGTLRSGSKMAQQTSTGRSWSIELKGDDLFLTDDGVVVEFRGAGIGGALDYQYIQEKATWDFLVRGGVVHWHGHEIRVGDTTYDLTAPGELVFGLEDWKSE